MEIAPNMSFFLRTAPIYFLELLRFFFSFSALYIPSYENNT